MFPILDQSDLFRFCFEAHSLSFTNIPIIYVLSCIGILYLAAFSPLHLHQPIYSHPLPVRLVLTHGQVCPCVASPNSKCIANVAFLSISTKKSRTGFCPEW